jgi:hypothetical protein
MELIRKKLLNQQFLLLWEPEMSRRRNYCFISAVRYENVRVGNWVSLWNVLIIQEVRVSMVCAGLHIYIYIHVHIYRHVYSTIWFFVIN